jgi:cell wall-associated NlpC family hydrolase
VIQKFLTLLFLAALTGPASAASAGDPAYRTGDIIFQTSRTSQSLAVQLATHSKFSHVGIVVIREGKPWVFEAVKTVKYTPLGEWVRQGVADGRFAVERLKDHAALDRAVRGGSFDRACRTYEGKPYDSFFGWGDDRIYCSELVWKVYREALGLNLAPLKRLKDFDLSDDRVQALMKQRYGRHIPLEEPVVSPSQLFESKLLEKVDPS